MFTLGPAVALDVPACMEPHLSQFHSKYFTLRKYVLKQPQ